MKVRRNIAVPRNRMEWRGSTSWTTQARWRVVAANSATRDSGASRRITVVIAPARAYRLPLSYTTAPRPDASVEALPCRIIKERESLLRGPGHERGIHGKMA